MAKGGLLGDILPAVLTIAGAAIGNPELGVVDLGLGATGGEALGAGLGSTVGNLATGKPVLKSLESGAISGAETGALAGLANNASDIGSALFGTSPTPGSASSTASIAPSTSVAPTPTGASAPIAAPVTGVSAAPTAPPSVTTPSSDILDSLQGTQVGGTNLTTGSTLPTTAGGSGLSSTPSSALSSSSSLTSTPVSADALPNTINSASLPITGASGVGSAGTAPTTGFTTPTTGSENSVVQALQSGSGSDIITALGKNANILIPGAGLAYQAISSTPQPKGYNQIVSEAGTLANQGKQLQDYLQSGTLPPGLQASLDQASASAKATIRSEYAARGMSGSSAEAQDLAGVDQRIQAQGASLAMQLLQQGVQETQLSGQIYQNIMAEQMQGDQNLGSAIANFATAASGGIPGGTIKIAAG